MGLSYMLFTVMLWYTHGKTSTVFFVSVDLYISFSAGAVCVCAWCHTGSMFVWEHGYPSVWIQSHLLQHQQTGPSDQLQPDQRWVSGEQSTQMDLVCRLLLKCDHTISTIVNTLHNKTISELICPGGNCFFIAQETQVRQLQTYSKSKGLKHYCGEHTSDHLVFEELSEKCLSS